jgi:hypothetical protein
MRYTDDDGLRYARATLHQIKGRHPRTLPGLSIRDWPDFPTRGYMLDISRDRVPTRETLERLVGLMALVRINQFQLYTEHTFAYRDHEVVWRDASPMTPDDIRWLDRLCRDNGIELVPNQNCFGHMARWLKHDAYRYRAETPDGFEFIPGVKSPPTVLAPTPENAAFALDLFDELLPNFSSRKVNIGCDETFELGKGASREAVEQRGKTAVYAEHLRRLVTPLIERGHEVQFWADIVRKEPAVVRSLPQGSIAVAWNYEAPGPPGEGPAAPAAIADVLADMGIDFDSWSGFAGNVVPIVGTGIPFWVAPGTSGWNSLVGRIDNAMGNLIDAAEVGLAQGATGYLITDWGDGGHWQPPSISFAPLAYGGAVSWALDANRELDVAAAVDRYVFHDASGTVGGVLDRVGRLWRRTGQKSANCSPLDAGLRLRGSQFVTGEPDLTKLAAVVDTLDAAMVALASSTPACADGDVVRRELVNACRLARQGAWRLAVQAGGHAPDTATRAADLREAIAEQEACWLLRSRPGGLPDSLTPLQRTLATI